MRHPSPFNPCNFSANFYIIIHVFTLVFAVALSTLLFQVRSVMIQTNKPHITTEISSSNYNNNNNSINHNINNNNN